jgi:heat shock protein HtpX
MSWDLWNPWGFFYELNMTHPLPAKRILALNKLAEEQGQMPYIEFDKVKPESYWDDFLGDIMAKWSFIWGFVIAVFMVLYGYEDIFLMLGLTLAWAGLFGFIYFRFYRHPMTFRDARVKDLLGNPKASPVRGIPVKLRGIVIGRGIPGLFFSEDLKIDDGTGLLLIDYKSIARIIDFFQGAFRTQRWVGTEVVIEGWYRRPVVPMLELLRMEGGGMERKVWRPYIKMGFALFLMVIGLLLLAVSFA